MFLPFFKFSQNFPFLRYKRALENNWKKPCFRKKGNETLPDEKWRLKKRKMNRQKLVPKPRTRKKLSNFLEISYNLKQSLPNYYLKYGSFI